MANIQGQRQWSPIRLLETHELARGGANGNLNEQAKALADRTEFLNQEKASKSEIVQGIFEFDTYAEFNSAKANLPSNCTVVIGEENTTSSGQWGIGNNSWNGSILKKSGFDPFQKSKDYVANNGYGKIIATNSTNINFDTSNKTLGFAGDIYIFSETTRYQLMTPVDLVFSQNGSYRLDFDILTGEITAKASTFARTEGSIVLAFVVVSDVGIKTNDFRFAINGVLYEPLNEAKDYVSKTGYGSVIGTALSNINYTTSDRTLNFNGTVYVFSGTTRYLLATPKSVPLPENSPYRLEFVISTGEIIARPYTQNLIFGNVILGFVTASADSMKTQDFAFSVNGFNSVVSSRQSLLGAIHGASNAVTVDTKTSKITFTTARVVADAGVSELVNQTLDYSAIATSPVTHYLYFDTATKQIVYRNSTSNWLNQENLILLASFIPATGDIRGLPQPYTRNGQVFGGGSSTNMGIVLSTQEGLNFNFAEQKIEVTVSTQVLHNGFRFLLPIQEIDITSFSNTLWFMLVVEISTGLIQVLPSNAAYSRDLVVIGAFKKDAKLVANIDNYSINGVSNKVSDAVTSAKLPSLGWDLIGTYTAPTMPGYRNSGADPLRVIDITSNMINGWFDDLVSANPEYITKTHLGDEYTGLPIYEYRFKPDMGGSTNPIKVLIHGATHGEPMSYVLPFHTMNLITNHWQDSPLLEALRFGVEFSVIPALNAWGVNNGNTRYNSRDVNLNRNYPTDWISTGDKPGTAPLSELEAQYAFANMQNFKPHVLVDVHSFGTTEDGEFLWITKESSDEARTCGAAMINRLHRKWSIETPDLVSAFALDRNSDAIAPGSTARAGKALGAISVTFEVGTKVLGELPTAEHYSSLAVRYGVEALINYLIILLRRSA